MRAAVILVAALAGRAEARPWGDLVGDYTGKLAWTNCSAPGAKSATLALDATDGALAIELAPAGGGLVGMSLVEDDRGALSAQQGDVTLAITPGKPNTIALVIELTSGCSIRGTLVRATTKVPACDRLVALARIERRCTKVEMPIAPQLANRWNPKDAAACIKRADAIEHSLVDAGCLLTKPEDMALACRQLITEAQKLKRCSFATPDIVMVADGLMMQARPAADPAQREITELFCRRAHETLANLAARSRCPL